jgi:hypothetical protein
MAEYTFNGLDRMVARTHGVGTGWAGNSTRLDYYNPAPGDSPTSGHYPGFDRFGRIVDQSHIDFAGEAETSIARLQYTYDANSNRLSASNLNSLGSSNVCTYDNLNRLTSAKVGKIDTTANPPAIVSYRPSSYDEDWTLDKLGNWSSYQPLTAGETRTHNATNEVTQVTTTDVGARKLVYDDFSSSTATGAAFATPAGTWSVANGKFQVDSLTSGAAIALTGEADWINRVLSASLRESS